MGTIQIRNGQIILTGKTIKIEGKIIPSDKASSRLQN